MKTYTFTSYDTEDNCEVSYSFNSEDQTWMPVVRNFLTFLRGCGFVFDMDSELGVMDKDGRFRGSEYY